MGSGNLLFELGNYLSVSVPTLPHMSLFDIANMKQLFDGLIFFCVRLVVYEMDGSEQIDQRMDGSKDSGISMLRLSV